MIAGVLLLLVFGGLALALFTSGDAYIEANEDWGSVEFDRFEIGNSSEGRVITPENLDDLPADAFGTKSLTLDLTEIETEALSTSSPSVDSEFTVLDGYLEVIVPEGLEVDINAAVEEGVIEVVGSDDDTTIEGSDIDYEIDVANPDISLDLDVLEGDIIISYE